MDLNLQSLLPWLEHLLLEWTAWRFSSLGQLGIVGGRLPGAAQLGNTLVQLGLGAVQLGFSLLLHLSSLLPLSCVSGHPGLPGTSSGQLGPWPGISPVQLGQLGQSWSQSSLVRWWLMWAMLL